MIDYRKEARGRECMVRIPRVCNHNPETTVLAHLNGGGMGMKRDDRHGAWCCSACHDVIDGRDRGAVFNQTELALMHHEGVIRTQEALIAEGKL